MPSLCPNCELLDYICLCQSIKPLHLQTRIQLIIHTQDRFKLTNTGKLVAKQFTSARIHEYGRRDQLPLNPQEVILEDSENLLLFPSEAAEELKPELLHSLSRPVNLIVLDGTWQQARRMSRRIQALRDLRRVKLSAGPASAYQLRRQRRELGVCTAEAVARAIRVLEPGPAADSLEELFNLMVERVLYTKGRASLKL